MIPKLSKMLHFFFSSLTECKVTPPSDDKDVTEEETGMETP